MIEKEHNCPKMTFDEFQLNVMDDVRKNHHMNLVESWERHVIYKDFSKGNLRDFYGAVYFADMSYYPKEELRHITMHDFSYNDYDKDGYYSHSYTMLHKEQIQAIAEIANSKGMIHK